MPMIFSKLQHLALQGAGKLHRNALQIEAEAVHQGIVAGQREFGVELGDTVPQTFHL